MAFNITPDMLVGAYEYLRASEPFRNWKLPEADDIGFHVVPDPTTLADFVLEADNSMHIRVNTCINHSNTLIMTIAHEMIHMYQCINKLAKNKSSLMHNADFKRRAKRVCAIHGWDDSLF